MHKLATEIRPKLTCAHLPYYLTGRYVNYVTGHANCIMTGMECFFGSYELPSDSQQAKSAVVTFIIPQIGISFKAPFAGVNPDHSDFASLLALLEFIDGNQKYFSNHTYQIFGNNHHVINAVNKIEHPPGEFTHLLDKALGYRSRYRFSIDWVAARNNPIFDQLFD